MPLPPKVRCPSPRCRAMMRPARDIDGRWFCPFCLAGLSADGKTVLRPAPEVRGLDDLAGEGRKPARPDPHGLDDLGS